MYMFGERAAAVPTISNISSPAKNAGFLPNLMWKTRDLRRGSRISIKTNIYLAYLLLSTMTTFKVYFADLVVKRTTM